MRVNQIQQPAPVEQVQNTAPTDGSFKFMLASHVEEAELQERLTNLMAPRRAKSWRSAGM